MTKATVGCTPFVLRLGCAGAKYDMLALIMGLSLADSRGRCEPMNVLAARRRQSRLLHRSGDVSEKTSLMGKDPAQFPHIAVAIAARKSVIVSNNPGVNRGATDLVMRFEDCDKCCLADLAES